MSTLLKDNADYKNFIWGGSKKSRAAADVNDEVDYLRRMLDGSSMTNEDPFQGNSRKVEFEARPPRNESELRQATAATEVNSLKVANLEARVGSLVTDIEALKVAGDPVEVESKFITVFAELKTLKTAGDGAAVKIANLGFKSIEEVSEWTRENFKGNRHGLIMDPLLLLDCICGEALADKTLKAIQRRINLKLTTGGEGSVIESLSNARPRLFHSGLPTMTYTRNESRLNKLKKHSDWESLARGGVREHIVNRLNELNLSISQDIDTAFGRSAENQAARYVAMVCLTASVTAITGLVGAVDAIYKKLYRESKFSSESAWCLTMQILDKICEELNIPKARVLLLETLDDTESMCDHILWAAFKSLDVMGVYVAHHFQNHPSMSTEFIRFLATNSGSEKIDQLVEQTAALKECVTKALNDTKVASQKADTATNKVADLVRELATITRRVKALEDRPRG